MKELTKEDMLLYFEELNNILKSSNKQGELLIAGGAALTLVFEARNSTYDIDAMFEPKEFMRNALYEVAEKHNLNKDWLNDGVKGFMTKEMGYEYFKEYSNLIIKNINAESLLAMKLTSARGGTKDKEDSLFLMTHLKIKSEKQLFEIIEKYIHPKQQTVISKYFTIAVFEEYEKLEQLKLKKVNNTLHR